jgi:phosphate starvation-inducible PhoH-like protein
LRQPGSDTARRAPWANDREAAQIVVAFDNNQLAMSLFGRHSENLALIERRLHVAADQRGNQVTIEGPREACEQARRALESLYEQVRVGHDLTSGDVEGAIRQAQREPKVDAKEQRGEFEHLRLRKRLVRARTPGQDAYLRALQRNSLVFAAGPAGTGKTWLAVAYAVYLFERRDVDRIVLSRPAVEAGERLGFLPGDMREKVDPYLRPIYDAFYDLMDRGMMERALQSGEIEIAPLAFMRGTGDPSQVDLPGGQTSGLDEAVRLLAGLADVAHCRFTAADVVRHELVSRIVAAYDAAGRKKAKNPKGRGR